MPGWLELMLQMAAAVVSCSSSTVMISAAVVALMISASVCFGFIDILLGFNQCSRGRLVHGWFGHKFRGLGPES